jgi:hypothetical protein
MVISSWLVAMTPLAYAQTIQGQYDAIIVNAHNTMKFVPLKRFGPVFLQQVEMKGSDQQALVPIDNTAGPIKSNFYKQSLGWSQARLSSYWHNQIFSGGAQPPQSFSKLADVIRYVHSHVNGVSYVPVRALYFPSQYPKGYVRVLQVFKAKRS